MWRRGAPERARGGGHPAGAEPAGPPRGPAVDGGRGRGGHARRRPAPGPGARPRRGPGRRPPLARTWRCGSTGRATPTWASPSAATPTASPAPGSCSTADRSSWCPTRARTSSTAGPTGSTCGSGPWWTGAQGPTAATSRSPSRASTATRASRDRPSRGHLPARWPGAHHRPPGHHRCPHGGQPLQPRLLEPRRRGLGARPPPGGGGRPLPPRGRGGHPRRRPGGGGGDAVRPPGGGPGGRRGGGHRRPGPQLRGGRGSRCGPVAWLGDPAAGGCSRCGPTSPALQVYAGAHLGPPFARSTGSASRPRRSPTRPTGPTSGPWCFAPGRPTAAPPSCTSA